MRRILIFITILIFSICGYVYYLDRNDADEMNRKAFDQVMSEKMESLYVQAGQWKKPLSMKIQDDRLDGDYKVMSEFILKYWMDNIEARNSYLRQLDRADWDHFLSPSRFDKDRKTGYQQTTQMLSIVKKATLDYKAKQEKITATAISELEQLKINKKMLASMREKLEATRLDNDQVALLQIEMQILEKANEMFAMLKQNQWIRQNDMYSFEHDEQVRKFNILYAEILEFQQQIDELKKQNARVFEAEE